MLPPFFQITAGAQHLHGKHIRIARDAIRNYVVSMEAAAHCYAAFRALALILAPQATAGAL
jgi:hypothetical protein